MKLIVSDLDGTLLNEHSQISDKTREVIRKLNEKGVDFAIATGRSIGSARVFKQTLGLDIYLICNNGANIYNKNEDTIFEKVMDEDLVKKIIGFFRENNISYNGFYQRNAYTEEGTPESVVTIEKGFNIVELRNSESFPVMSKIIVKDNPEIIRALAEKMKTLFADTVDITISQPRCLDIVHKDCSKGKGIKIIAEKMNIPLENIMAFGDGENDFDMLQTVGHPVVMENGLQSMKEKICNIAPKNTDNGVAEYLEKFFNL